MMNRRFFFSALVLFLLAGSAFCQGSSGSESGIWEARIVKVRGDVNILTPESPEEYYPALADTPLQSGDTVQTGADGSCEIMLESGNLIHLDNGTEFNLTNLQRQSSSLTLSFGSLLAKLTGLLQYHAQLELRTPTAVAAVRGTEFAVESYGQEFHVGVLDEGKIAVRKPGTSEEVLLTPNRELEVWQNIPVGSPTGLRFLADAHKQIQSLRKEHKFQSKSWKSFSLEMRKALRGKVLSQAPTHRMEMAQRIQSARSARTAGLEERRTRIQKQTEKQEIRREQLEIQKNKQIQKEQEHLEKQRAKEREYEMKEKERQRRVREQREIRKLKK